MILDTNAVSALFVGDTGLQVRMMAAPRIYLPLIVSGEYRVGLRGSNRATELEDLLRVLERECGILTIDVETTRHYADIRYSCRKSGTPIPENDLWIAAMAFRHGLPILSRDRHFDSVAGVERIAW